MCLSTAYLNEKREDTVVAKFVTKIQASDGKVQLTDIMGESVELSGTVTFVDLEGGTVVIRTDAA